MVALVLAAGAGERLGGAGAERVPKGFVPLGGRPIVWRSLAAIAAARSIDAVLIVVPDASWVEPAAALGERFAALPPIVGGSTRQGSVRLGLAALPSTVEIVVCHDAARPFASPELFDAVVDAQRSASTLAAGAADGDVVGAIPIVPSPDTVKRIRDGFVLETLPRSELGLAQTPQAFDATALRDAHRRAVEDGFEGTDDAVLLERLGHRVAVVAGDPSNFKITTPADLARAERLVGDGDAHG